MDGRGIALMLALAGALLGVSCGGSEDGSGEQAATASGGSTTVPPGGVPCGSKTCTAQEGAVGEPCCMSPFEGKCGELQGGTCAEPPPVSASGCPGVGSGGLALPGCCAPNGMCGIDPSQFMPGLPCIDLATAAAFMPPGASDGGISFELPDPRPCPPM